MAETYLEFYEGALVGFAAVMTDAVILNTGERRKLRTPNTIPLGHDDHPVVPAVKIARLAVADGFRTEYSGGGQELVRFAGWLAFRASELVACRLLTVDAYPDAVAFYERIGFVHNRAKEYRERNLASMRLDLFSPEIQGWLFE